MSEDILTHIDSNGKANMVDVGGKADTERIALAKGEVILRKETIDLIRKGLMKKGDVLSIAEIAGVIGAKKTSELIPLCHAIPLYQVNVNLELDDNLPGVQISAFAKTIGKTGVEMEALTAVSIAALVVYDMVKAVEKTGKINNIRLIEKHGGRSGDIILE